jgi:hypothetical protein
MHNLAKFNGMGTRRLERTIEQERSLLRTIYCRQFIGCHDDADDGTTIIASLQLLIRHGRG